MSTKKQTLVEKIMAMLNLGEAGKMQHFIDKQVKIFKREIDNTKQNIKIETYNSEARIEKLEEKLADARETVDSEYMNIRPEDVVSNAVQDSFGDTYWARITSAEAVVERLEKQIEAEKEALKIQIESFNKEIAERERRISKIS